MAATLDEDALQTWRTFLGAYAACVSAVERSLAAAELPPLGWYDVLFPLHDAPERRLRMGELAERVVTISRSGLTRLVDRLEAAELVRREPTPADRRGTFVAITPQGSAMLRRMWPVYAEEIKRCFADVLDEREAAAIRDALARVGAAARDATRPDPAGRQSGRLR